MPFCQNLKRLLRLSDFFYSTQMLRYEDENQFKTLTGGIVSIAIIATIIVGFASMILDTLGLNSFNISAQLIKNKVPTPSVVQITEQSAFRFAIQIWRQNITESKRFFDITFRLEYQNEGIVNQTVYFPLEPCSIDFFKNFPEIIDKFDRLQAETWLCPSLNTTLNLQGKYSSAVYNQYIIQVSACNNDTDPSRPCASPQEIQNYFQQNQNFFYFGFYFTNTQINPDKKNYKQYYIEDQSYAIFGSNVGAETFFYLTDYTVQTDYSIWPFSNVVTDSGCYAQDLGINHPFQTHINGTYITWNIAKSTNSIVYSRSVQKLSAVFSFMGGMIGAISALLFIIKVYTNLAFEFSIASQIFKSKEQTSELPETGRELEINQNSNQIANQAHQNIRNAARKKRESQMSINFLSFLQFQAYRLFDMLNIRYESSEIRYAQECREQILKQLDIKKILKRIIFIEHCLTKILDDYHLDVLQLRRPETPEEIREIRLKCESIVDHQQEDEQKHQVERISFSSMKHEEAIVANEAETANNLVIAAGRERRPRRLPELKRETGQFQPERKKAENGNQKLGLNLEEIKEEKIEANEDTFKNLDTTSAVAKVEEHSKIKKKRESNLIQLLKTAQEGNELSNRLFKKLDKETKRKAVRYSNMEAFSNFYKT